MCGNSIGLGGKEESACGPGTLKGVIDIDSPKEVEVNLSAYAVNIPNQSDEEYASFPQEYPTPYLRYEYSPGEFKYTDELENWYLVDEVIGDDGNTYFLYRSDQMVKIRLPEDSNCNSKSSTIIFNIEGRLSSYSDQNEAWEEYPVLKYASTNDIFSCEVFKDTKHVCDPKLKPSELTTSIIICASCDNEELINDLEQSNHPIKNVSNPFSEILEFNYISKDDSELTITLLSQNGSAISTNYLSASKGRNILQIPTETVSNGIYFLSVFDGTENHVEKVICVK